MFLHITHDSSPTSDTANQQMLFTLKCRSSPYVTKNPENVSLSPPVICPSDNNQHLHCCSCFLQCSKSKILQQSGFQTALNVLCLELYTSMSFRMPVEHQHHSIPNTQSSPNSTPLKIVSQGGPVSSASSQPPHSPPTCTSPRCKAQAHRSP